MHLNATAVLDDGLFELWLLHRHHWPIVKIYAGSQVEEVVSENPNVIFGAVGRLRLKPRRPYRFISMLEQDDMTPFGCEIRPSCLVFSLPTRPRLACLAARHTDLALTLSNLPRSDADTAVCIKVDYESSFVAPRDLDDLAYKSETRCTHEQSVTRYFLQY